MRLELIYAFAALVFAAIALFLLYKRGANGAKDKINLEEARLAAIGEMSAFMTHQWRQPLNSIAAALLKFRSQIALMPNPDSMLKDITACENTLEHLSSTLENFRNFYAPSRKSEYFSPASAIYEMVEIVRYALEGEKVSLKIECDKEAVSYGVKSDMMHIVLVLLTNSMDAFRKNNIQNRKIDITLSKTDDKISIEVGDNAGGIPIAKLTDIFKKRDKTGSDEVGGIGLYMAHYIAKERFGGKMSARNVVGGARFTITVPSF